MHEVRLRQSKPTLLIVLAVSLQLACTSSGDDDEAGRGGSGSIVTSGGSSSGGSVAGALGGNGSGGSSNAATGGSSRSSGGSGSDPPDVEIACDPGEVNLQDVPECKAFFACYVDLACASYEPGDKQQACIDLYSNGLASNACYRAGTDPELECQKVLAGFSQSTTFASCL